MFLPWFSVQKALLNVKGQSIKTEFLPLLFFNERKVQVSKTYWTNYLVFYIKSNIFFSISLLVLPDKFIDIKFTFGSGTIFSDNLKNPTSSEYKSLVAELIYNVSDSIQRVILSAYCLMTHTQFIVPTEALRWLPLVSVFTHYFIWLLSNVVHCFKTVVR